MTFTLYNNYEVALNHYENCIKDLVRVVNEELTLYVRNLVLYGSFAKQRIRPDKYGHYFMPGESDIDVVLLINQSHEGATQQLQKVVESLNSIIFEPFYGPILDLAIIESDVDCPIPVGDNFNIMNLHSVATSGDVLFGVENYFSTFEYTIGDLKTGATKEIHKNYSDLKNAIIHRDMYKTYELFWMGIDSLLNSALTYGNYLNHKNGKKEIIVKREVADYFTSNPDDLDIDLIGTINDAIEYTIDGSPADNGSQFEFFLECTRFCRELITKLKST